MDTFWGHSNTFWVAIEAIAVCSYNLVVVVTLLFIYRQVRTAAKTFQFETICRLQQLIDDFREDRARCLPSVQLSLLCHKINFLRARQRDIAQFDWMKSILKSWH